jgi:hypothetical protein
MIDSQTSRPKNFAGPTAAARAVGVTPKRVRTLIKNRRLDTVRLPGSRPMVDVSQLRELVQSSTTPALFGSGGYR